MCSLHLRLCVLFPFNHADFRDEELNGSLAGPAEWDGGMPLDSRPVFVLNGNRNLLNCMRMVRIDAQASAQGFRENQKCQA